MCLNQTSIVGRYRALTRTAVAYVLLLPLVTALGTVARAQEVSPAEQEYVGNFGKGSVDGMEQLLILNDHTFCYVAIAGALDLRAAGRWRSLVSRVKGMDGTELDFNGIELQEVKSDQPDFVVHSKPTDKDSGAAGSMVFDFYGPSISMAHDAVFAVSSNETEPRSYRSVLGAGNVVERSYKLPAIEMASAKFFYLGHVVDIASKLDAPKYVLRVFKYPMVPTATVRVGFDYLHGMKPVYFLASMADGKLQLNGEGAFNRREISTGLEAAVRDKCIAPVLYPVVQGATVPADSLRPVKTLDLGVDVLNRKQPWFVRLSK